MSNTTTLGLICHRLRRPSLSTTVISRSPRIVIGTETSDWETHTDACRSEIIHKRRKVVVAQRACLAQADTIAHIADSVNIHTYAYQGKGFLVYGLTKDEYEKRIKDNSYVYVFMIGKKVIGFVCGYDRHQFEDYLSNETLGHEPVIGAAIGRHARERGDQQYAFLDQIAILPRYQDQGYGELAFNHFCEQLNCPYCVAMAEGPLRNPRIEYWQDRGFIRIGEAIEYLPDRFNGIRAVGGPIKRILWGIYTLPMSGFRPIRHTSCGD